MDTTAVLRRQQKGVNVYERDGCQFFRIRCDILNRQYLEELTDCIEDALKRGKRTIVLSLTADSYVYSELIGHVMRYSKIVQRYNGTFCLVEEDSEIREILDRIGLSKFVRIVSSEEVVLAA